MLRRQGKGLGDGLQGAINRLATKVIWSRASSPVVKWKVEEAALFAYRRGRRGPFLFYSPEVGCRARKGTKWTRRSSAVVKWKVEHPTKLKTKLATKIMGITRAAGARCLRSPDDDDGAALGRQADKCQIGLIVVLDAEARLHFGRERRGVPGQRTAGRERLQINPTIAGHLEPPVGLRLRRRRCARAAGNLRFDRVAGSARMNLPTAWWPAG